MMLAALILIIPCLQAHMLQEQLYTNKSRITEAKSSSNYDHFSSEQSLGYSMSHVLMKGPKLEKVLNLSNDKSKHLNAEEEIDFTLLEQQKVPNKLQSVLVLQYNHDIPLRFNNAHLLSKLPSKHLMISGQLNTENITNKFNIKKHQNLNNSSSTVKQTESIVNERKFTESDPLKYSSYNRPASSYASASSWAGGYGRPSAGGAAANAQASASAEGFSASSSSGSSAGHYGAYQTGGTGSTGGGSNSGSHAGSPSLTVSGDSGGSMTSLNTGIPSSGSGGYNTYFMPPSTNNGVPAGASGESEYSGGFSSQSSGCNTGNNSPNLGSIAAAGSSSSGFSFPVGAGFSIEGPTPHPGGYYGGYKPSIGESSGSSATGVGGTVDYQGNPTVSTSASTVEASGYHSSFNRPPSGAHSASTSSTGSGGSAYSYYNKPFTGNYNAYNRPTTSFTPGNYNHYKPSTNSGTISTSSSGHGTYNTPPSQSSAENNLNVINKPISGTTSKPTGAYYNGYFITTSPNSEINTDSIYNNRPSNGELKPSAGSEISSNNFAASTSGSSSGIGIGIIPGPQINSGIPTSVKPAITPNFTALFHVPWWLETGVFSSSAGSLQGIGLGSSISSSIIQGVNNFGSVTPTGLGTGGAASISTSGAGNQGGGPSFGAGSVSNPLMLPGISSNFIPGNNNIGAGSSMGFGSGEVTSISASGTGIQGGRPPPGIISGVGSSSSSTIGSNIHGVGIPSGSFVGSTSGYQTNGGVSSLMGVINNNLGSISTTESSQVLGISTGDAVGLMQPEINPGLTPEVTTSASLINSGISILLPWWFVTGVFSGSINHPGVVGTAELTGLTTSVSSSGSIVTPGWTGIIPGTGSNLESGPLGETIGIQPLPNSKPIAGTSSNAVGSIINIEPTLSTEFHSENHTLGIFQSGLPEGVMQTGLEIGSKPEIFPEDNSLGSSGLVIGPTVPGNLPTTVESSEVESFISSLKPGNPPFNSFSSGSGSYPAKEPDNNQGQVQNLTNSSGLATSTAFQNNVPINPQLGLFNESHNSLQGRPSKDEISGRPQSNIHPDIHFPSSSQSGFPSVSEISVSPRPHGWSGGDNGPASLIGFQSRPNSGSLASAGTFSSTGSNPNTIHFPYKVSEDKTSDTGTISVFQQPWLLVEADKPPVLESSKEHHTALNDANVKFKKIQ